MAYQYNSVISKSPAIEIKSGVAGGTLEKFTFVKYDVNGNIIAADTEGEHTIGVVQQDAVAGDPVSIITRGESFVQKGNAHVAAKGDNVTTNATAKVTDPGAGDHITGVSLEDVVAGDYYIKIDVIPSI